VPPGTEPERAAQIFHVSDGQITEFWSFAEDQDTFDEFWS
jgi:hypothetical protein